MEYWLHRISYLEQISYPLIDKGYLSIGFSDFCDNKFLDLLNNEYTKAWELFENEMIERWKSKPRNRYCLWNFIKEMKKGDWVLVPEWGGTFSIYELLDDSVLLASADSLELPDKDWNGNNIERNKDNMLRTCDLIDEDDYLDIGFLRKCKPLCLNIPRQDYADAALTSRMKIRSTNALISDLKESIDKAVELFKEKRPINLKATLIDKTVKLWDEAIREQLNPDKYEKLVKWYFERCGASSVVIPPKNESGKEGDRDVTATFEKIKTIIYVQVKFHEGETSDWAVEQIKDFEQSKCSKVDGYSSQFWVISSAENFSEDSFNKSNEYGIQLINGKDFIKMLMDVGIESLENFDK